MLIVMSKLKKEFSNSLENRIKNLENELEEFKKGITEENLRLKVPYVADVNKQKIGISAKENGRLGVYLNGELKGEILFEQEVI